MNHKHRGHPMHRRQDGTWVYTDTSQLVSENPDRACGQCGRSNTAEGHDGCLGALPSVANACCGHGDERGAYVVFDGGERLGGAEAVAHFGRLSWRP